MGYGPAHVFDNIRRITSDLRVRTPSERADVTRASIFLVWSATPARPRPLGELWVDVSVAPRHHLDRAHSVLTQTGVLRLYQ